MHELAICQSLIAEVERVAQAHDARAVRKIVVTAGPLAGIEPSLLERAFEIARAGTVAAAAALEVEMAAVRVWCDACGAESEAAANALLCRICGGWRVRLCSGADLVLKSVELTATATQRDALEGAL